LARLDLQLQRLGWNREQEAVYLERVFGHPNRNRLTSYGDLLAYLQALEGFADGSEPALTDAVQAAHDREMTVLALTGHHGGGLARQLRETDVHVCVPHERAARIREVQHLVLHCLCDGIDTQLLGEQEPV
jgi:phosphoheptose isomerase